MHETSNSTPIMNCVCIINKPYTFGNSPVLTSLSELQVGIYMEDILAIAHLAFLEGLAMIFYISPGETLIPIPISNVVIALVIETRHE